MTMIPHLGRSESPSYGTMPSQNDTMSTPKWIKSNGVGKRHKGESCSCVSSLSPYSEP